MFSKNLATICTTKTQDQQERRGKYRFPMQRDLRYKLLKDGATVEAGSGHTIDIGSGGVAFSIDRELPQGSFIELAISWPVLLGDTCPMRLIAFGRVVRSAEGKCACTIDKYEFRTQSRAAQQPAVRSDSMLQRWADAMRKDPPSHLKMRMMSA